MYFYNILTINRKYSTYFIQSIGWTLSDVRVQYVWSVTKISSYPQCSDGCCWRYVPARVRAQTRNDCSHWRGSVEGPGLPIISPHTALVLCWLPHITGLNILTTSSGLLDLLLGGISTICFIFPLTSDKWKNSIK